MLSRAPRRPPRRRPARAPVALVALAASTFAALPVRSGPAPAPLPVRRAPAPATPAGKNGQIAFRRYLGPNRTRGAIFVTSPDGSGERQLTTAPAKASDDFPDVSPDGRFVAFQRCRNACGIYVVNSDASGLR